jgi:flagellar motility protein MotE (MotC chaperone)
MKTDSNNLQMASMAKQKTQTQLDRLKQKQVELAQRIKAAQAAEKAKNAKREERRNAIAGRIALAQMKAQPQSDFASALLGLLSAHVKGPDRALFDLPSAEK